MAPVIHDSDDEELVGRNNLPSSSKGGNSDSSSELSDAEDIDIDLEGEGDEDDAGDDEEEEDDDDDLADTTHYSDELLLSDDEDGYKLEDPDEMDEDLELKEDRNEVIPKIKVSVSGRETRKRQLTYYEDDEDEDDEDDEHYVKSKRSSKSTKTNGATPKSKKLKTQIQPTDLDADLILTDEEAEYNPLANPDLTKMTSRQRAMYDEEEEDKSKYLDLDDSLKPKKKKKQDDQQIALRKAESARRRQDYKNKQEEEEKRDIVNKLLKRRATKTRENQSNQGPVETSKVDKQRRPTLSHPAFHRYLNNITTLNGNSSLSYNE